MIEFRSKMIECRLKLRSSTQIRCWISNQTEIDNQNWQAWNPNGRHFDSQPLMAFAWYSCGNFFKLSLLGF